MVTNVFPRTYPWNQRGSNADAHALENTQLTEDLKIEHVTRYVYRCPQAFSIHNIEHSKEKLDDLRLVVDTPEDLVRGLSARGWGHEARASFGNDRPRLLRQPGSIKGRR